MDKKEKVECTDELKVTGLNSNCTAQPQDTILTSMERAIQSEEQKMYTESEEEKQENDLNADGKIVKNVTFPEAKPDVEPLTLENECSGNDVSTATKACDMNTQDLDVDDKSTEKSQNSVEKENVSEKSTVSDVTPIVQSLNLGGALEESAIEVDTNQVNEAAVDEPNESQDSLGLIIDEKMDEQDVPTEEDEHETDDTKGTDKILQKVDSKDSCEDISEVSVVTQIDVNEIHGTCVKDKDQNSRDKVAAGIDDAKNISSHKKDDIFPDLMAGVIEIEDEFEDEQTLLEVATAKNLQKTTEVPSADDSDEVQISEELITIIEIDDDDEDEQIKKDTAQPQKNVATDDNITAMEVEEEHASADVPPYKSNAAEDTASDNIDPAEKHILGADVTAVTPDLQTEVESNASTSAVTVIVEGLDDDTSNEVFSGKECINYECPKKHKQFFRASQFAMSYYKVTKKRFKGQFICAECYDKAFDMYEEFCGLLVAKQPMLLKEGISGRQEFVEIIDSSDEDDADNQTDKEKTADCFSKEDLDLIDNELESSMQKMLQEVDIQTQLTWSKTILSTRVNKLEEENIKINFDLSTLQKKADSMHFSLYQCPKIKIRQLKPLDLNSGLPYSCIENVTSTLPPVGEIQRPPIQLNAIYYAVKNKAIASWVPCRVIEQVDGSLVAQKNLKHYKVKFLKSLYQMLKIVSVKHLAYYNPPKTRLPIGSRVIAYFDASTLARGKEKVAPQRCFYPGIIAEPLKPNNKYRYLVFYDDGYAQYVYHRDVRLVCNVSDNVWEDVHQGSRDFIQKYLTQYSINRPMVQTQKGQSMTTESKGKWIHARVVDIDCSLIQMQFEGPNSHTEWIYRGSMRLGPVFKECQPNPEKNVMPVSRLPRRTEPFIRYTEDEENTGRQQNERIAAARAVAKKSVSRLEVSSPVPSAGRSATPSPSVRHLNNSTIYVDDEIKPKGKVVFYTAKRNLPPLVYKQHECSPSCLFKIAHDLGSYSPLSKPLLSGWERLILRQKVKKLVTYRAPCGKIMRNMKELRQYLRITENVLNVDHFDFSHEINCLAEYVIESAIVQKRDISGGQEQMPIPLVNYYDNTMPPACKYAAQRIPTEGVNLNLDPEYLVGCDCEGDCSDKAKCSCWQLTYAGAKYGNPNTPVDEIGYQYKRLLHHIPTGIYECNSRCKCKANCLNRVVQQPLQMKLQVFKTSNRGWGLRCLNDIPRGSFICIYAGHLLTEANANADGIDAGDEYFAELDYIEVAEQIKEGYESDVEPPELPEDEDDDEEELYAPDPDDDEEFTPSKSYMSRSKRSSRSSRSSQNIDEDSQERQVINFNPNADLNETSIRESSIRKLFGRDEACYVMDAKIIGNLGRYFNHSCSPNLFVQNVFVDTHDLRFPWVAFFAQTNIRAGTELTWNYNYEVGVVPGKVLYCQCGAPNCRLRLL